MRHLFSRSDRCAPRTSVAPRPVLSAGSFGAIGCVLSLAAAGCSPGASSRSSQTGLDSSVVTSGPLASRASRGRLAAPTFKEEQRAGSLRISVNPVHPSLFGDARTPRPDPVTVVQPSSSFRVHAFARYAPGFRGVVWLEFFVENMTQDNLKGVSLSLDGIEGLSAVMRVGGAGVYDFTQNPMEALPAQKTLNLDRIAPRSVARVVLGLPHDVRPIHLDMKVTATTTPRYETARNTSPVRVAPDGKHVWAVFPDNGVVSVVETATRARIDTVRLGGKPTSVDITPDGRFALVSLAHANKVVVLDASTRDIVSSVDAGDGLGREPRALVVSPDGTAAYVSSYVDGSVSELSLSPEGRLAVTRVSEVGPLPTALAVSPDGGRVFVSHFLPRGPVKANEAWVTTLKTRPLSPIGETVLDDPFNLKSGAACFAKELENPILRALFGKTTAEDLTLEGAPSQLAGMFLNPSGTEAWSPGTRIAGAAPIFERGPNMIPDVPTITETPIGEFTAPILYLFDSRGGKETRPLLPLRNASFERPVPKGYAKCLNHPVQIEYTSRDLRKSDPGEQSNRGTVYPGGDEGLTELGPVRFLTFSPGGRRAFVVSYGSDEIAVHDAMTHHPVTQKHFLLSGNNPTGMDVSPDGKTAYVVYANSPMLSVLDVSGYAASDDALPPPSFVPYRFVDAEDVPSTRLPFGKQFLRKISDVPEFPSLREVGQVALDGSDAMDAHLRRGKILFDSGNPLKHSVSATRLGNCAGCHPDGGSDGSAWSTVEGERKTSSLRGGVAGRGWLHISATHHNADEFVRIVVPERLGGKLEDAEFKALADYVAFGIEKLQHPTVDAAKAARGKALFEKHCAGCHAGEKYTSSPVDPNDPWGGAGELEPRLFDKGTTVDRAGVVMGPFFERSLDKNTAMILRMLRGDRALGGTADEAQRLLDYTPRPERPRGKFKATSLVNVWENPMFFHAGQLGSLEEVLRYLEDRYAFGMSEEQQGEVVEFLKTL